MERKSIGSHILNDMWNANLMVGDEVRNCVIDQNPESVDSKIEFCQGIFCTFPHVFLTHFTEWMWPEGAPRDFKPFMEASLPPLQQKVFPELESYFREDLSPEQKGQLMATLLTQVIPQHVLTGYYDYMYADAAERKDLAEFWKEVQPLLDMTADMAKNSYYQSNEVRAEVFLYLGCRYPFLLLKRWYDWQYGKDVMERPVPAGN